MKATLGYGASTCSYADWLSADLIVFFGSNVAEQPAGHDEVPALREAERRADRGRQSVSRARPRALLGPVDCRERAVRHRARRSLVRGRTPAATSRSSSACCARSSRSAASTRRSSRERTRRLRRGARRGARPRTGQRSKRESGATRERIEAFARLLIERPNAVFVWSMGLTQHAHGVETVKALMNVGARARAARAAESRPRCRSAGTRACRAAPKSAACRTIDAATARALGERLGVPGARRRRAGRPPRWSSTPRAARSTCFWIVGGNFLETLPDERTLARARSRGRACASTRTSCCPRRCSSSATATCCCCRRRRATNRRAAAPRPRPSGASSSRRRFPGGGSARRGRSGGCSARSMARAMPERAQLVALRRRRGDPRRRSRAPCRCTRASRRWRRRAIRCSGAGRTLYADGRFATPDGKAHFAAVSPTADRAPSRPRSRSSVSTRRGKQFNSMVQRDVDPLTGAARDDVLISADDLATPRLRRRRGRAAALGRRHVPRAGCKRRRSSPATSKCTGPKATRCCRRRAIDPESMEPDYNATVDARTAAASLALRRGIVHRTPCDGARHRYQDRRVRDRFPPRRGRHGRSLPRARHEARPRRRHQGPAASVAADPDRLARFEREARLLASLNHPNIAAIYGVEDAGRRDRARPRARRRRDAQRAHRAARGRGARRSPRRSRSRARSPTRSTRRTSAGIVHRDLKPANIVHHAGRHGEGARLRAGEGDRRGRSAVGRMR